MFLECFEELFFVGLKQLDVKACPQSIECVYFDVKAREKQRCFLFVKYVW